jgi:hypothetical protein
MRSTRMVVLLLLSVLATACQTAQMKVATPLQTLDALRVEGANPRRWNAPIRFGPWRTSEVDEGLTWNFGIRLLGLDLGVGFQPYRFVLASEGQNVQAECVTRSAVVSRKGLSVEIGRGGRIPPLACGFTGSGEGTLRMRTTLANRMEGDIDFGQPLWTLRSVHEIEGARFRSGDPVGYEIRAGGRVIAAVETINRGRVWIDPSLDTGDRSRIAAVSTALLLYEPPGFEE